MRKVINASCDCDRCVARTTEMYDLPGRCLNCGETFTVRNRKGDKPPLAVECPACGVDGYLWRDLSFLGRSATDELRREGVG